MRNYERELIFNLNAVDDPNYYNICVGGYGGAVKGHVVSDITREKISKSLSGRKSPKEVIEKYASKLRGKKQKEEHVIKRSEKLKEYYENEDIEKLRKRWDKISKSSKGIATKNETKEKISKTLSKLTDDEVMKIVEMIENKVTYDKISDIFNISPAQITSIKQKKTYKWLW